MAEVHSIEIKVDSTQAQTASQNLQKMANSAGGAESALRNLTRAAVGLVALDQLGNVAKGILETNRAMESLRAQLTAVTGSAVGSQRAFKFIQDFATSTPYEVEGLTKAFITLQNYGIKPTKQVMEAVTNQASKLGGEQQTLEGIVRALGQAYAKGKLQAEEMLQLAERGVPVYDLLSQVTGKNAAQLQEMAAKGELTRATIERLIAKMNEMASGANAAAMETLNGKISNLSDAWHQFEDALLNDKSEGIIKSIVDGITSQINKMTQALQKTPVQKLEEQLAMLRQTPGYDEPIKNVEKQLEAARKVATEQAKIAEEQSKAEDARVAKQEEARKKLLGSGEAVTTSKKQQAAATKALHEAEAAFGATLEANIKAAQNAARIQDAQSKTAKLRLDNELAAVQQKADLDMKEAQSYEDKLRITSKLQAKQEEIITKETNLRLEAQAREEEILAIRIQNIEQEIAAADRYNLTQSERIRLQTELDALLAQQQIMPEERTQIELESIRALTEASREYNELRAEGEANVREEALRTLEVLSSNLEFSREMAAGMQEAFGSVGAAIGQATISLAEYAKQQATIQIQAEEEIKKNPAKKYEIEKNALEKQSKLQVKTYGDMAKAAQGFFKQGTKGYEAMGAAVKVFRAVEMVQSALSVAQQLDDIAQVVTSFITGETTKAAASAATVPQVITSETTKQVTLSKTAIAAQGQVPIVGFALMAAMAAALLAYGVAGGGGGSSKGMSVEDMQKQQDEEFKRSTATMLGSSEASSSIVDSLEIIAANSTNDLDYTQGMANSLELLVGSIDNLVAVIAQNMNFDISKLNLGTTRSSNAPGFDPLAGMIFGTSKTTRELLGQGLQIDKQTLGQILGSGTVKAQEYADILITTSSSALFGLFKSTSQSIQRETKKLDPAVKKALADVFESAYDALVGAGKLLGKGGEEFERQLQNIKIKPQDLKLGKNAEENAKKIEAWLSAQMDRAAEAAFPNIKEFQRAGEGAYETAVRVGDGFARAKGELERLGFEAINYTEITRKKGDVDIQIAKETLIAQSDLGAGAKQYINELTGSLDDVIDSYKKLAEISRLMDQVGASGANLDRIVVNAAGGLDELQAALEEYYDRFLTPEQQIASETRRLTEEFGKLGLAMPKTMEEFTRVLLGFDDTTESGKKLFGQMVRLSGSFADLTDKVKEQKEASEEAAKQAEQERKRLEQERLSTLQKAIDDAFSAMQKAYQDLTSIQDRFIKLSKSLRSYMDELVGPASQTISPEQRYFLARQEFERIRSLAGTGNEEAVGALAAVSKTFLDASRNYNASSEAYQSDLAMVVAAVEASTQYADDQVALAQQSMDIAKAQYDRLGALNGTMGQVNSSVLSVNQGIANMNIALANYAAAVSSKQAELTAQLAAANAAAAAAQAAAAQAANTSNATPMPRPTYTGISATPVAFGPASPATGYSPSSSKYKWGYDHAYNMANFYYEQLLNRQAEEGARRSIANQLSNAYMSEAQIVAGIRSSPEYQGLIARGFVPGFAKGGAFGPGLAMVGEQGPEMVSFNGSGHVSSAGATSNFFSSIRDAINITSSQQTELLKEQVSELQALVRLQSAANRELINQLSEIRTETAESTRIAKVEASA